MGSYFSPSFFSNFSLIVILKKGGILSLFFFVRNYSKNPFPVQKYFDSWANFSDEFFHYKYWRYLNFGEIEYLKNLFSLKKFLKSGKTEIKK